MHLRLSWLFDSQVDNAAAKRSGAGRPEAPSKQAEDADRFLAHSAENDEADEASESSSRVHIVVGALIATCVLIAVLVAAFAGRSSSKLTPGKRVPETSTVLALFAGIPEHGLALGEPNAPVTLIELADLQCPTCSQFAEATLPELVSGDVREGRLRIVFKPVDVLGGGSVQAAQMAVALSAQQRMWPFIDLMYSNQGPENSGYVTNGYLRALVEAIPGASLRRALAATRSGAVNATVARASAEASQLHAKPGPIFLLSRTGKPPKRFIPVSVLEAAAFTKPIDALLARG